jgi:hypothetical protein
MFTLNDTFNNRIISNHRSLVAAAKAKYKHQLVIERRFGKGAYLTYEITNPDGQKVDEYDLMRAEQVAEGRL